MRIGGSENPKEVVRGRTEFLDQEHPSQIPVNPDLHGTRVQVVCPIHSNSR
jgi:hypothetical protein